MNRQIERLLQTWKSYLGRTEAEIRQRFPIAESEIDRDSYYGELTDLTEFYDFDTYPAHFFFKDGRCVLLLIEDTSDDLGGMSPEDLNLLMGYPAANLPSHAGKASRQYVYPEHGVAYSANYKSVDYMEIFARTNLAGYESSFYSKPK